MCVIEARGWGWRSRAGWMGWGVVEGLFLLDEQHFNPIVLGAYAAIAVLLFLPASNAWFRRD